MPTTPRLNVSLIGNDGEILEELRTYLEKRLHKRLTMAEVIRTAIHNQHAFEKHMADAS